MEELAAAHLGATGRLGGSPPDSPPLWTCFRDLGEFCWREEVGRPPDADDVVALVEEVPGDDEVTISASSFAHAWALLLAVGDARRCPQPDSKDLDCAVRELVTEALWNRLSLSDDVAAGGRFARLVLEGHVMIFRVAGDAEEDEGISDNTVGDQPLVATLERRLESIFCSSAVPGASDLADPTSITGDPVRSSADGAKVTAGLCATMLAAPFGSFAVGVAGLGILGAAVSTGSCKRRSPVTKYIAPLKDRTYSWTMFGAKPLRVVDGLSLDERRQGARALVRCLRFLNSEVDVPTGEFALGDSLDVSNPLLASSILAALATVMDSLAGDTAVCRRRVRSVEVRGPRGCAITLAADPLCPIM